MHNHVHVFDFSFVALNRELRTKPQLVFTLNEKHLPELTSRLRVLASRWEEASYLGVKTEFALPLPDLFGNTEFGYKKCGLVTFEGDEVSLRLELSQEKLSCITATIHLLTMALGIPYEPTQAQSNRQQQIEMTTACDYKGFGYGHALGGYVSAEVREWLCKKTAHLDEKNWITEAPPEIVRAMRQAWSSVVSKKSSKWARECRARISHGGRFMLSCLGDACDVSIYPDAFEGGNGSVRFSCHNLDQACQQVTLLAGLATLCELVRKETL